jgi:predicted thioesterase
MKNTLQAGARTTRALTVDRARTIDFLGETLRIYATPELIRDIEHTCLDFLQAHVDDGESSVGTEVSIRHSEATLLGGEVTISVEVAAIDGRSVSFRVSARDAVEEICTGTHSRFVVNVAKLRARVEAKAAQIAQHGAHPAAR